MAAARPRVSAILLSYDCAAYIEDALRSVIHQDCELIEIFISDDASHDETYGLIEKIAEEYAGPHHLHLRRQIKNSGSKSAHLNQVIGETTGEIIVSFDGDDVYDLSRVRRILQVFDHDQNVQAVYSTYTLIDQRGTFAGAGRVPHPPTEGDAAQWFAKVDSFASGSTLAVRRAVFEKFSPLPPRIAEDVVLPFRASLLGSVCYIDEPLVWVRRRSDSLTANYEMFQTFESYRRRMQQGIEEARRKLVSRLDDLDRASELMPERAGELEELRKVARRSFKDSEMTLGLFDRRFFIRVKTYVQVLLTGAYPGDWLPNLAVVLTPGLYLMYKRRHLGIN